MMMKRLAAHRLVLVLGLVGVLLQLSGLLYVVHAGTLSARLPLAVSVAQLGGDALVLISTVLLWRRLRPERNDA